MGDKGFNKSNIESKQFYLLKHIGTWLGHWALTTYYCLVQNWPKTDQDWILFALLQIAYITGVVNSLDGASKVAQ